MKSEESVYGQPGIVLSLYCSYSKQHWIWGTGCWRWCNGKMFLFTATLHTFVRSRKHGLLGLEAASSKKRRAVVGCKRLSWPVAVKKSTVLHSIVFILGSSFYFFEAGFPSLRVGLALLLVISALCFGLAAHGLLLLFSFPRWIIFWLVSTNCFSPYCRWVRGYTSVLVGSILAELMLNLFAKGWREPQSLFLTGGNRIVVSFLSVSGCSWEWARVRLVRGSLWVIFYKNDIK